MIKHDDVLVVLTMALINVYKHTNVHNTQAKEQALEARRIAATTRARHRKVILMMMIMVTMMSATRTAAKQQRP